jgi:glycosyltransferase involved in cell wall biosynthesis
MISVGLDLSALDPSFKSHACRGIGRYVSELRRALEALEAPDVRIGTFAHSDLRRDKLADKIVSLLPCGRTSVRQHLVYPSRLHHGRLRDYSLLHYPAHMDAPAWSSKPYVLTVLDLIPHVLKDLYRAHKPGWRYRAARSLEVRSIKQATLLLAISECTAVDLQRVLGIPRERIVVTPLGVDDRFFTPGRVRGSIGLERRREIRLKLGIPVDRPIVLYVGGHDERKNIATLVGIVGEARNHLVAHGQSAPVLVMAGRLSAPEERHRLEAALRHHDMAKDTINLGYVGDEELGDLYTESALFLFPTLYEGFGLPALEAMAAGLPVVGSSTSSIPEVVGEAGELFNPLSISDGARAVLAVLENEERGRFLSARGIERAKLFSWERTARATVEGYRAAYGLLQSQGAATGRALAHAPAAREVDSSRL